MKVYTSYQTLGTMRYEYLTYINNDLKVFLHSRDIIIYLILSKPIKYLIIAFSLAPIVTDTTKSNPYKITSI